MQEQVSQAGDDASIEIEICNIQEVDQVWPLIVDRMKEASIRCGGQSDPMNHWSLCRTGNAFLIIVRRGPGKIIGAGVWTFEHWINGKKLRCLSVWGYNMASWYEKYEAFVIEMARVGGATSLVAMGRKGWERVEPRATVLAQLYEVKI